MSSDWKMPRRGEQCCGCGRPFEPGQVLRAALYPGDEGYERRDYCPACPPPAEPAPVGCWKTRCAPPATRKLAPFDREAVYGFFERLADADGPQQVQFRFVLALLLWRKKVLRLERTDSAGGREVWAFVAPRTGAVHEVVRPGLDEAQLDRLSGQLEMLLAGLPGDPDAAPAPFAPEDGHA